MCYGCSMKPTVYVETSVFGFLTARASRDLISAARQAVTLEWWLQRREKYALFISALVEREIKAGDPEAARRRGEALLGIQMAEITPQAGALAEVLLDRVPMPRRYTEDALHIAVAAVAGLDYLLTWNFKHINNAQMKKRVAAVVEDEGYECPAICSPEEL